MHPNIASGDTSWGYVFTVVCLFENGVNGKITDLIDETRIVWMRTTKNRFIHYDCSM